MLCNFFGPNWLTSGWLKMVYLKQVFRGDTMTCRAVVKGSENAEDRIKLNLEVRIEKNRWYRDRRRLGECLCCVNPMAEPGQRR